MNNIWWNYNYSNTSYIVTYKEKHDIWPYFQTRGNIVPSIRRDHNQSKNKPLSMSHPLSARLTSLPFAWRRRLQSKSKRRPCNFFRWCCTHVTRTENKNIRQENDRPMLISSSMIRIITLAAFACWCTHTITSFRSFVCKWCSGSRTFCLILSSREYLTSAICFSDSPVSISDWAVIISKFKNGSKWSCCSAP